MVGYREIEWTAGDGSLSTVPTGRITPLDPTTFRGSMRRYDLGGVVADVVALSPHRYDRTPADVDDDGPPRIETLVVGEGEVAGSVDGRAFSVADRDVLVLEDRHPIHYRCETGFRMLRIAVDSAVVPPNLLTGEPLPARVIPRTKLVNSTVAFLSALFAGPDGDAPEPHLRAVLIEMQVALVAQARRAGYPHGTQDLRGRIEEHVRAHLFDPALSPATIAAANGISLRYLHLVFNREEETIARYVREERLAAVARALTAGAAEETFEDLGARFGFRSRDHLARAFRSRYGMTMTAYRAGRTVH